MNWRHWQRMQRVAEIGDNFLSYVDEGQGAPIVLLHGIPTWGYLWNEQLPALARVGRVLVPDLLGYGFSDKRDGFDRSPRAQADAIDRWLDGLGIENATIVGHDIGGGVAQILALRYPRRVGRLCLLNCIAYDNWPLELVLQLGRPRAWRHVSPEALQRLLRVALRRMAFAHHGASRALEGLLAPWGTEVSVRSLMRNAAATDVNQTLEVVPHLPRITVPALVLWGENDTLLPLRWGERLAWDLPNARLVRVPSARHFVMLDQPDVVNRALLDFLGAGQAVHALEHAAPL